MSTDARSTRSLAETPVREHVVRPGDCLAALAQRHGLHPDTIWSHPANRELAERRPSGRVLEPGDVVRIPERRAKRCSKPSGERHRFVRKGTRARLRLQLRREGEPRRELAYTLAVDRRPPVEGATDADGWIDHPIPPGAERGVLVIPDDGERIVLRLGHLDPEATPRGAQSRLRHLGFYGGRVDGELGDASARALAAFQRAHGLGESGALDAATSERLREEHGS